MGLLLFLEDAYTDQHIFLLGQSVLVRGEDIEYVTLLGPGDLTLPLADTVAAKSRALPKDDITMWKREELRK